MIKFIELLPKTGDSVKLLLEADGTSIIVKVSQTLLSTWQIDEEQLIAFAKLRAELEFAKDNQTSEISVLTYDYEGANGHTLSYSEAMQKINDELATINEKLQS